MLISIIVAVSTNGVIAHNNAIPWHLPNDLRYFKKITQKHHIIMGRKTWQSLPIKPLPQRTNIIISTQKPTAILPTPLPHTIVCPNIENAFAIALQNNEKECFIIGGQQIYEQAIPYAHRIYCTQVHTNIPEGDVFFPNINPNLWRQISYQPHSSDSQHAFNYAFTIWERLP